MTVEIEDESLNDLLSPIANTQLIRADFLLQKFLEGRHLALQFIPGTDARAVWRVKFLATIIV